jgi:hypothetical protein
MPWPAWAPLAQFDFSVSVCLPFAESLRHPPSRSLVCCFLHTNACTRGRPTCASTTCRAMASHSLRRSACAAGREGQAEGVRERTRGAGRQQHPCRASNGPVQWTTALGCAIQTATPHQPPNPPVPKFTSPDHLYPTLASHPHPPPGPRPTCAGARGALGGRGGWGAGRGRGGGGQLQEAKTKNEALGGHRRARSARQTHAGLLLCGTVVR